MRAFIYSPYLDSLGGGERYMLTAAWVLSKNGYTVDVYGDESIKLKATERFGINLEGINFTAKNSKGEGYDMCLWLSDGSIPLLHARSNLIHIQMPFRDIGGRSLLTRMKLIRIKDVIVNSHFTKKYIDSEFGIDSRVLYPPVDVSQFKPKHKDNIILYVGRFSQLTQSKHQDVLIKAFSKLSSQLSGWKLILVGGTEVGVGDYIERLTESAKGFDVAIIQKPPFSFLKVMYGRSKIFWSAAGYSENEKTHPERMEHFGMTVVEAMSAGCLPIVYNGGGHPEIVKEAINGFLYSSINELVSKTIKIINNKKQFNEIVKVNKEKIADYSVSAFETRFLEILNG
jgi:glycosyltransferase involved in cell wall biosynthesis